MLDASIRTGIMRLMTDLAERLEVSYLYITHDLAVARYMCGRIAVMYLGKIVEIGETEELLQHPLHPYTKALLSAVPVPDPTVKRPQVEIEGGVTRPVDPPPICRFYDRCPIAPLRDGGFSSKNGVEFPKLSEFYAVTGSSTAQRGVVGGAFAHRTR